MAEGFTITATNSPNFNFEHNGRTAECTYNEEHLGPGDHQNIVGGNVYDPRKLVNDVFKDAVDDYNSRQTRSDRKIDDYYKKICEDGRFGKIKELRTGNGKKTIDISRKPIYEMTLQIGNADYHPDRNLAKNILIEFVDEFKKKYGANFKVVRADYHDDEYHQDDTGEYTKRGTPHVHLDYVPVVNKKMEELVGKGVLKMTMQHSLSQACEQAGFTTDHLNEDDREQKLEIKKCIKEARENGDKEAEKLYREQLINYTTYTNQQKFEEDVRYTLANFVRAHGLEVDLTPGKKHSHSSKNLYQLNKEKEKLNKKLEEINAAEKKLETKSQIISQKEEQLFQEKARIVKKERNLEIEKKDFEEDKRKADELLAKESEIHARNQASLKFHKIATEEYEQSKKRNRKKLEEEAYIKDYMKNNNIVQDFDAHIPKAELIDPEDRFFTQENREDYTKRNLNHYENIISKAFKAIKTKYNHLVACVKTLLLENRELKKTNKRLHDNINEEVEKGLEYKVQFHTFEITKENKELKNENNKLKALNKDLNFFRNMSPNDLEKMAKSYREQNVNNWDEYRKYLIKSETSKSNRKI